MNNTDVFFNNGQLDLSAISTIINIILFVLLVGITWWNVLQVRKHTEFMIMERDVKEMECLVGKLHSKITDKNIFFKLSPERRNSNGEGVKEHFRFWDKIEQYIYLGPPELRSTLNKYIESKSKSSTDEKYEKAEADLIKEIKNRYDVLTDKIESSQRKIEK